jgi:hypothetical protein
MVNDDDLRISDLAEIVEVDWFGSDLESPQHDGVQLWSSPLLLRSPSGIHTGERGEEAHGREGERCSQHMRSSPNFYMSFSPHGVPLYRRMKGACFIQLVMWD